MTGTGSCDGPERDAVVASVTGFSVLGLGNLGGKRHPNTNNIPLSFPKLKDSFPLS